MCVQNNALNQNVQKHKLNILQFKKTSERQQEVAVHFRLIRALGIAGSLNQKEADQIAKWHHIRQFFLNSSLN